MVDKLVVDSLESSGIDIILSVPCDMLSGIILEIKRRPIQHISVCREEEGVGIAAGCALAGRKPMLLMQNSGLGNSINALMSLTYFYKLPLFILMSHRGGQGEKILAQVPMGKAAPLLLDTLNIDFVTIKNTDDLEELETFIKATFKGSGINAAFLYRELWHEAK
jgi:sulfopyruvate decarboxylase alpha subunit